MAIIKKGNALTTKLLQPGGTYQTDGYGLLTGKATFLVDSAAASTAVVGGQVHPSYSDMFVHKFTLTKGALGLDTIEAEYVGIDSAVKPQTRPNVTASLGLTSEHITTHPNFFGPITGYTKAIAGTGTTFSQSTINKDYKVGGEFGAHFKGTDTNAGGFVGFLDSSSAPKQFYYGKSNYLAPTTSFSGSVYSDSPYLVTQLKGAVGKTSKINTFAGVKLIPDHMGTVWEAATKNGTLDTLMLSQVSFEDYCVTPLGTPMIYKANYEIKFNREGFPKEVYQGSAVSP
jgi:hypothetical protein